MGDRVEGFVQVEVEVINVGVEGDIREHGVDVAGSAVLRCASILVVDEELVWEGIVCELSGAIGGEDFVDGVEETDGLVVDGIMWVSFFVKEVDARGKPVFWEEGR